MADNITYYRLAFEDLDNLNEKYDVITSSLAFDYVEGFRKFMTDIQEQKQGRSFMPTNIITVLKE